MTSTQPQNDGWGLLQLPPEVRHVIYQHLFCTQPVPIWIGKRGPTLYGIDSTNSVFCTQLFRVCKMLHRETVSFAYRENAFELQDGFPTFCNLGSLALSSIQNLSIVPSTWRWDDKDEDKVWEIIQNKCTNLKYLELDLHSDRLLAAIPFLQDFVATIPDGQPCPTIIVDLYVWDMHFSFGPVNGDYSRTRKILTESVTQPSRSDFETRMLKLPHQAVKILVSADVTIGTVNALDDHLASMQEAIFHKTTQKMPRHGRRALGRSHRYWYSFINKSDQAKTIPNTSVSGK